MRSRKTSTLKDRILSIVHEGNLAVVLRPQGDSARWQHDEKHPNRVTHDGQSYLPIELPPEMYKRLAVIETKCLCDQIDHIREMNLSRVLIDEFQFFNTKGDAFDFLTAMAKDRREVIIAGLTLDWKRQMFPSVIECYGMFTEIIQNYAVCTRCGKQATFTAKLDTTSKTSKEVFQVGDKEYESRCHACF